MLPGAECPCPTACPFATPWDGAARPRPAPECRVRWASPLPTRLLGHRSHFAKEGRRKGEAATLTPWQGQGLALHQHCVAPQLPSTAMSWPHRCLPSSLAVPVAMSCLCEWLSCTEAHSLFPGGADGLLLGGKGSRKSLFLALASPRSSASALVQQGRENGAGRRERVEGDSKGKKRRRRRGPWAVFPEGVHTQ